MDSCRQSEPDLKTVRTRNFSMTVPTTWRYCPRKGVDSEVGMFVTEKQDTIFYDYGLYSDPLNEDYIILNYERIKDIQGLEFDAPVYFSANPEVDRRNGKYSQQVILKDTIDNLPVKIVRQKKGKHGITGVHFERTKGVNKLTIQAENLDSIAEMRLLESFNTINFK